MTPANAATDTQPKPPWEMTRAEWWKEWETTQIDYTGSQGATPLGRVNSCGGAKSAADILLARMSYLKMNLPDQPLLDGMSLAEAQREGTVRGARHRDVIREAIEQGRCIPPHVLAEYEEATT